MKHIDLFSGIGGFALAARWMGWETIQFCEKELFAQEVLKKNFPGVPISTNIFNLHLNECTTPTILTGGFPCQPFSQAGKRKGMADARAIWPQMLRIIHESRPTYVVAENVFGIINISNGLVFENVCADLESEGYEVQPVVIPASSVGAYHQRQRVWFVAHSNCNERFVGGRESNFKENNQTEWAKVQLETSGLGILRTDITSTTNKQRFINRRPNNSEVGWPIEPPVCSRTDGLPGGLVRNIVKQFKGYGNSIVPQVAYEIFKSLSL